MPHNFDFPDRRPSPVLLPCRLFQVGVIFLALAALHFGAASTQAQVSFAGTQLIVAGGVSASLSNPVAVALDGSGNVYIADRGNNRVLSVPPAGSGFGAPTTIADGLAGPSGVAADWTGNVFIADTRNNRVVKLAVTKQGFAAPVTVGSGINNPVGIAVDWSDNLYVTESGSNQVVELPFTGGGYAPAVVVATGFNNPTQLAVDSKKNLFIDDTGNNRVIKELYSPSGYLNQQRIFVGSNSPAGITVDKSFNVYAADTGNGRILEGIWNSAAGRFNTTSLIAGGIASPQGLAVDTAGNLFVADAAGNRVLKLVNSSVNFNPLDVGAAASVLTYQFEVQAGTTVGNISIYTQGVVGRDFNDAGGSSCAAGSYSVTQICVVNVSFSPLGPGQRNGSIVFYDPFGNPLSTAFISGVGIESQVGFLPGNLTYLGTGLSGPSGVTVDGNGNVFISDTGNDRVVEIPWTGSGYGNQTTVVSTGISSPLGLAVDGADNLYVVSNGNDKVVKLPWLGQSYGTPAKIGTGLYGPAGVTVDGFGSVYIADTLNNEVLKLEWTGTGYAPERGVGNIVKAPSSVAVDIAGDVYFTGPYSNNLAIVSEVNGSYLRQVDTALSGIQSPASIVVDSNSDLYVLDAISNVLVMLPWTGTTFGPTRTVANGFNGPTGLAIDSRGNLYVADSGNNQIVKIDVSSPASLHFPNVFLGSKSLKPLTTTVSNIGNQTLTISEVDYPLDFPGASNPQNACVNGTSLAPGQNCRVSMNFVPQTASTLSESVSIVDNTLNAPGSAQFISAYGVATGELPQSITFPIPANVIYGAAPILLNASASSGLPVSYQVVSGPGSITKAQTLSFTGSGSVVITATQSGNSVYQAANPVTVTVYAAPAVLTVTAVSASVAYGSLPKNFSYTVSGFVLNQTASQVITGSPLVTCPVTSQSGVGAYTLNVYKNSMTAANYTFTFVPGVLTVTPARLVVTAVSVSGAYGQQLPTFAWTVSGLKNNDPASVISGVPAITASAGEGAQAGTYSIMPAIGSLNATNYTFSFVPGVLTIIPAVLTVTPVPLSITYGKSIPSLSFQVSGFVNGDSQSVVTGTPSLTTAATQQSVAGIYSIQAAKGSLAAMNYVFKCQQSTLTILKATLTVSAASISFRYGSARPGLTYTISGFVHGDGLSSISGHPQVESTVKSQSPPGTYGITVGMGSLSARNYTFNFVNGTATVSQAPLSILANSAISTYGEPSPQFTFSVSGLVNGDTQASAVIGQPLLSSVATKNSGIGIYQISVGLGSLQSQKYILTLVPGSLAIHPALLTVIANNASMTAGSALPALSYTTTGLVGGDTAASAINGSPSITTTATSKSAAGSYTIVAAQGTLQARNYVVTYVNGTLKITQ